MRTILVLCVSLNCAASFAMTVDQARDCARETATKQHSLLPSLLITADFSIPTNISKVKNYIEAAKTCDALNEAALFVSVESEGPKYVSLQEQYLKDPKFRSRLHAAGYSDVEIKNEFNISRWFAFDLGRINQLRDKLVDFGYSKSDVRAVLDSLDEANFGHYLWLCYRSDESLWKFLKAANRSEKSKEALKQLVIETGRSLRAAELERKFGILEITK